MAPLDVRSGSRAISAAARAALVVALLGWGCSRQPSLSVVSVRENPWHPGRYRLDFETMGTEGRMEVVCADRARAASLLEAALQRVQLVNRRMSTFLPDSEISELNRSGSDHAVHLSEETMCVLRKSVEFARLTGGAFDVTYAPLRRLWWEAQREGVLPGQGEIERALRSVGSEGLVLGQGRARFERAGMEVDLGAIAKGFAIDLAAESLRSGGALGAMVNIGGDMRLVGAREDGRGWKIRVRTPPDAEPDAHVYLSLRDVAVATSGDYARCFSVGDRKFSHIIDPRTGWPVRDMASVTVVAPDAITADALATAVSVLGPQKGIELIDGLEGVECMIIARTGDEGVEVLYSEGFARYLLEE